MVLSPGSPLALSQVKTIRLRLCSYVVAAPLHALIEARLNEGFRFVVSGTSSGGSGAPKSHAAAGAPLPSAVLVQMWQPQVLLLYLPRATHGVPGNQSPSAVRVDLDVLARSDFCQLLHGLRRLHARERRIAASAAPPSLVPDADAPGSVASASALLLAVASIDTQHGAAAAAVRRLPLTANPGTDVMSERFALRQSPLAVDRRRIIALAQFVHAMTQVDAVSEKLASPPLDAYHASLVQYYGRRSVTSHTSEVPPPVGAEGDCANTSNGAPLEAALRVLLPVPLAMLFTPLASLSVAAWHRWFHVERLEVVMRFPSSLGADADAAGGADRLGEIEKCWGCALLRQVRARMQRWADVELPWSSEVFRWPHDSTPKRGAATPGPLIRIMWPDDVRAVLASALKGAAAPSLRDGPAPPVLFANAGGLRSSATVVSGFSDARSKKARTVAPRGGRAPPAVSIAAHLEERLATQLLSRTPKPLPFVFVRVASPAPRDEDNFNSESDGGTDALPDSCGCRNHGTALVVVHVALYGLPPPARTEALRSLRLAVSGDIFLAGSEPVEAQSTEPSANSPRDVAVGSVSIEGPASAESSLPRFASTVAVVRAIPEICAVPLARIAMRGDADFLFYKKREQQAWAEGEGADFFEVSTAGVAPAASGCAGSALPPSILRSALCTKLLRWTLPIGAAQPSDGVPGTLIAADAVVRFHRFAHLLTQDVASRAAGTNQLTSGWQWLAWSGSLSPERRTETAPVWNEAESKTPVVLGRAHLFQRLVVGASLAPSVAQMQLAVVVLPPGYSEGRCFGEASSSSLSSTQESANTARGCPASFVEARTLVAASGAAFEARWHAEVRMQVWLEGRSAVARGVCDTMCAALEESAAMHLCQ